MCYINDNLNILISFVLFCLFVYFSLIIIIMKTNINFKSNQIYILLVDHNVFVKYELH